MKKRRGKKKATSQIVDQMDVNLEASKTRGDCEIANNGLAEGNVSAKRKRKTKKVKSKAGNNDEVKSRDQLNSMSYLQLSDKSFRQEIDDKLAKNEGVQHTNQDMIDIETVNLTEGNMNQRMGQSHSTSKLQPSGSNLIQEICDKLAENVDVQHAEQNKVDTESTVNLTEGNVTIKRKRKMKRIKRKTGKKDELQSMDQSNSASNLQSDNNFRHEIHNKLTENEDVGSSDQKKMVVESTYNLAEGNMSIKRKQRWKKAKSKHKNKDKVQSMDLANDISNLQLQLSENNTERSFDGPMRLEGKVFPCESQQKPVDNQIPMEDVKFQNVLNEVNSGLFVVEGTTSLGPSGVKEAKFLSKDLGKYPSRPPTTADRRKLIVLDVNGLLAYIVMPPPKDRKADINILRRAVFKRPFCDDFLKFCFQNFDVGIWSSRAKEVIDRIVDYLLENLKPKLLFCWNMSQSTQSGFKTLENIHKPLVCKELKKIWENDGFKFSWKKGRYNESNTLLIDDSPYKALLNPLHNAIFPHPYHYEDKDDNSLGPGGDLRVYLEGLLKSENVQEYVEHHPFGQSAINEMNASWQFYSGVLQKFSDSTQARNNPTSVVTSSQSLRQEIDDKLAKNEGVQLTNQDMIDIETINLTEGNMNQRMGQSHSTSKLQLSGSNLIQEICDKLAENVDVQHAEQNKVDTESTVNLTEGNVTIKRNRKMKRIKRKTGNKDELQSMDQSNSASNLQSDNNFSNKLTENEDVGSSDQKKMVVESTYNLAEGNTSIKRKQRRKKAKSKHKNKDKVQSMDLANDISNLQLSENNTERAIDGPMRLEGKAFPCESQQKPVDNQIPMEDVKFQNVLNEVNSGLFVVEGTASLGPSGVKEAESLSKDLDEYPSRPPSRPPTTTDSRKLLVLDVNGLLAYIVMPPPKDRKADINILRRAVFKRPFCNDFLKFCFQNFDVGIWSSRAKEVIDRIVDYLLGNLKPKLLFCWNMSQSTQSGFKTLENIYKPLVCKELKKIWENDGFKFLWMKGRYNESNTLLIDDSPYKALLNPLHTAIFPHPYHYEDKDDNSLGPGGDLRVYLEGLLKSENVQEYVEHHPFGQSAINETNVSWQFYSGVLQKFSDSTEAINNPTSVVTSIQNLTSPPRDKVLDIERTSIAHSTATPINAIDPEVHHIHSSTVVSASQ